MSSALRFSLRNDLSELERLASQVEAFAEAIGLSAADSFNLNLVLDELVTNIVQYAYADSAEHRIEISLQATAQGFEVWLRDDGRPFNPLQRATPELESPLEEREIGGLGLHFVRRMMDRLAYQRSDGHNQLHLVKQIQGRQAESPATRNQPFKL